MALGFLDVLDTWTLGSIRALANCPRCPRTSKNPQETAWIQGEISWTRLSKKCPRASKNAQDRRVTWTSSGWNGGWNRGGGGFCGTPDTRSSGSARTGGLGGFGITNGRAMTSECEWVYRDGVAVRSATTDQMRRDRFERFVARGLDARAAMELDEFDGVDVTADRQWMRRGIVEALETEDADAGRVRAAALLFDAEIEG